MYTLNKIVSSNIYPISGNRKLRSPARFSLQTKSKHPKNMNLKRNDQYYLQTYLEENVQAETEDLS